ncbi:unnamed protein product [Thelazia callipaeda]|uniref:CA domain-containing protein n=1 Tax=Thelazia callipaeda TaxID=103827 RepID=A0A158RB52_THECL|nr:unnamed protein product [Thelazia callipaeda]
MRIYRAFLLITVLIVSIVSERQQIFNVSENVSVGYIIGYINGAPSDGIVPNFYIVFPDDTLETEKYLNVEKISGEIRVLRELDYELISSYHLIAIPMNNPSHGSAIHVIINVIDENDNTPTFPVSSIDVAISEFAGINSETSLPPAIDNDSLPLSVAKYHILSGNVNNAFRLSSKRITSMLYVDLIVNGQLDREYRDHYELIIEAVDGGNPPRSSSMLVNVTVLDVNDNAPEFSQSRYNAVIPWNPEKNYVVTTIQAVDPDLGENARVAYSIAKNYADQKLPFKIDEKSGIVQVTDPNILVSGMTYDILIIASDHGLPQPLESTAFLSIVVETSDQPKLALDIFWLTDKNKPEVLENITVGHIIARIAVQNAPEKSTLSVEGCDSVCVQETDSPGVYLAIVCGPFDRESKFEYNLFFAMKSQQNQLLQVPIFFEVLDVNDNAPKFVNSTIRVTFDHSARHQKLVRIQATDADIGNNSRIQYHLTGTNLFEIDSDTGVLSVHESFECTLAEHHFQVHAQDFGNPMLSSTAQVIAQIIESDARPPTFTRPLYDVIVKENVRSGICLLKVS